MPLLIVYFRHLSFPNNYVRGCLWVCEGFQHLNFECGNTNEMCIANHQKPASIVVSYVFCSCFNNLFRSMDICSHSMSTALNLVNCSIARQPSAQPTSAPLQMSSSAHSPAVGARSRQERVRRRCLRDEPLAGEPLDLSGFPPH